MCVGVVVCVCACVRVCLGVYVFVCLRVCVGAPGRVCVPVETEQNPQDTDLYRLRKKHLTEMVKIKYDLEIMRQAAEKERVEAEVELLKKEGSRREWLLQVCACVCARASAHSCNCAYA